MTTDDRLLTAADPDQGSFLNGFMVGLFAGAAGYFLFATHKGEKIRGELAREWSEAQSQLQEVAEVPPGTLRQALGEIAQWFGMVFETEAPKTTDAKAKSKKPAGKKTKFKGV